MINLYKTVMNTRRCNLIEYQYLNKSFKENLKKTLKTINSSCLKERKYCTLCQNVGGYFKLNLPR